MSRVFILAITALNSQKSAFYGLEIDCKMTCKNFVATRQKQVLGMIKPIYVILWLFSENVGDIVNNSSKESCYAMQWHSEIQSRVCLKNVHLVTISPFKNWFLLDHAFSRQTLSFNRWGIHQPPVFEIVQNEGKSILPRRVLELKPLLEHFSSGTNSLLPRHRFAWSSNFVPLAGYSNLAVSFEQQSKSSISVSKAKNLDFGWKNCRSFDHCQWCHLQACPTLGKSWGIFPIGCGWAVIAFTVLHDYFSRFNPGATFLCPFFPGSILLLAHSFYHQHPQVRQWRPRPRQWWFPMAFMHLNHDRNACYFGQANPS